MNDSCTQLEHFPDEILLIIFKNLDSCHVLYSFVGLNQRLDRILNDRIFTRNLTLINSTDNSSYQVTDTILDRFCFKILPQIKDKIERLDIESSFIDRILSTNYPNLNTLNLYDFAPEKAEIFSNKNHLIHRFQNQISSLLIKLKPRTRVTNALAYSTKNRNTMLFIEICSLFTNLRYLNFSSSSDYEQLTFSNMVLTQCFPNLYELHVVVENTNDCSCLLNGSFNQLHTFHVTIQSRHFDSMTLFHNHNELPNLKCFSLVYKDRIMGYDVILAPLIHQMINLEELSLCFVNEGQIVDGEKLEKNIINHMSRLNRFTFNIGSMIRFIDGNLIPSNEDITNTFENFNNQIISNIDYFSKKNFYYYHSYSYPYTWKNYYWITNNFSGGLFEYVHEITLFDEHPFQHDFFFRIAESFPFVKKINIHNYEPQEDNHHEQRVVNYHHLINIDLSEAHEDYLDEFLNAKKTCLLTKIHLRVPYDRLKKVTNNFTRDETRVNCSKINHLFLRNCTKKLSKLKDYFPHGKIN